MNGFRLQPKATNKIIKSCEAMLTSFSQVASIFDRSEFLKKNRKWRLENQPLTKNKLSGYHSFIIENTKV